MNETQLAAKQIDKALALLYLAGKHLKSARNEQHIQLYIQRARLEEIHDILIDPECTPEIVE